MRILFLGAGAVGGYFGGRLSAADSDVTFLVRERRARQLESGLVIRSPVGDAVVPVRTILAGDRQASFDVIVMTCKAFGLDAALDSLEAHVHDGVAILPLLNGLAHIDRIETRFPNAFVWGGVAQIPANLDEDGAIIHRGTVAAFLAGPRPGQEASAPRASHLVAAAKAAGISASVSVDAMQDLWDKWVFLCALAAATCLARGDVGEVLATAGGAALLQGAFAECVAVAEAEGFPVSDAKSARYRSILSDPESRWTASMRHDLENGGPTEAEHIIGKMCERAEKHGIPTPLLALSLVPLQVHERRLTAR